MGNTIRQNWVRRCLVKAIPGNKRGPGHCGRLHINCCHHSQEAGLSQRTISADYRTCQGKSTKEFTKGDERRKKHCELGLKKLLGRRREWGGGGGGGGADNGQRVGGGGWGNKKGILLHRQYGKLTILAGYQSRELVMILSVTQVIWCPLRNLTDVLYSY